MFLRNIPGSGPDDIEKYFTDNPDKITFCLSLLKVTDVNMAMLALFEAEDAGHLLREFKSIFPEKSLVPFRNALLAVYRGEKEIDFEAEFNTLEGRKICCRIMWREIPDLKICSRLLMAMPDNNDKKHLREKDASSAAEWGDIFDSISELITIHDRQYNIIKANRAARDFFGIHQGVSPLPKCYEIFHGVNSPPSDCPSCNCFISGTEESFERYEPYLERYIDVKVIPRIDRAGNVDSIIHIVRDVTRRKKMEEELLKNRKIEALGLLAGGIAHDFNNLLQGILGCVSVAKKLAEPGDKIYTMMEIAEKAYEPAINLTSQLITFSRGGKPIKLPIDLKEVVRGAESFTVKNNSVTCEYSMDNDLWLVEADKGQILQVFHNLIKNAVESMPEGGRVFVSARNVHIKASEKPPLKEGNYVCVSFADEGVGIEGEDMMRIFDPYFSTKNIGNIKGMGLGLTISFSIVKNHDGVITADSQPGQGAIFHVYLPAVSPVSVYETVNAGLSSMRKPMILFMDDADYVKIVAKEFFDILGYDVEFAENGGEAVEKYRKSIESGSPFDLVILDLTVPGGMGGKEAIPELLRINPSVNAVVSSGYSDDPVLTEFEKYGFKEVLPKPYKLDELRSKLSRFF